MPPFLPTRSTANSTKSLICRYFRETWQGSDHLCFRFHERPKPIFFPLFCLIDASIPRKYHHFGHFVGKRHKKSGGNGKFWIFFDYFYTKTWKSNENISKCQNGDIVNHNIPKSLISSLFKDTWCYLSHLGLFPKNTLQLWTTVIAIIKVQTSRHLILFFFFFSHTATVPTGKIQKNNSHFQVKCRVSVHEIGKI